jgi:hypothetical protein
MEYYVTEIDRFLINIQVLLPGGCLSTGGAFLEVAT